MNEDRVIRVETITKVYTTGKTKVHALRGVDMDVKRGEMIAIMGASGSGKSISFFPLQIFRSIPLTKEAM